MSKTFFEVFPTLVLDIQVKQQMEQVEVEKITSTSRRDFLRIYICSSHLIQKEIILKLEREIKEQLFKKAAMTIKIYEKFQLSVQYTPEKFFDVYQESILTELKEYDHILYNAAKGADILFDKAGIVALTVKDTVLVRSKSEELVRILEKIFNERAGFAVTVQLSYKEAETGKYEKEDETKIAMQVAAISARINKNAEGAQEESQEFKNEKAGGEAFAKTGTAVVSGKGRESKSGREKAAAAGTGGKRSWEGKRPAAKQEKGQGGKSAYKRSDNPDVLYGRDFDEEAIKIEDIIGEMGEVVIRGKIANFDKRDIRNEKTILFFDVTDFTDTLTVKLFVATENVPEISAVLKPGSFVKIKGIAMMDKFDHELTIGSIAGIKKISDFTVSRVDTSARKRVELHCHTKMSAMDGVSEAKDIVKRAYKWGHPAIAITDHGVVQGFTDANHVWDDLWKEEKGRRKESGEKADKQDFFKVIYGVEAYIVDDLKEIVTGDKGQGLDETYVVFDIETTGFSPINNRIIEIGAVKVRDGEILDRYSTFVNPEVPIPFEIEKLTSINDAMVVEAPKIEEVLPQSLAFCEGTVMVAHNASFDMSFIRENAARQGFPTDFTYMDTMVISRVLLPNQNKHTLDALCKTFHVSLENHHRAVDDAEATAHIFLKFMDMLAEEKVSTLKELNTFARPSVENISRLHPYHCIILAKNDVGRINLYRLVSMSHLTYFNRQPKVPKSEILRLRDGLIIGSACEAGELYRALLEGRGDSEIAGIVGFYDYLEIQPLGNNQFMIAS
ncbi:MAG: PHP domain-containing protein, partial [Lachnospiraceae bacterium]|nr:PHP domain-containing protein [Lachnospiraceae bacterium]